MENGLATNISKMGFIHSPYDKCRSASVLEKSQYSGLKSHFLTLLGIIPLERGSNNYNCIPESSQRYEKLSAVLRPNVNGLSKTRQQLGHIILTDTGQEIWANLHLINTGPKILQGLGKQKPLTMSLFEIQLNI